MYILRSAWIKEGGNTTLFSLNHATAAELRNMNFHNVTIPVLCLRTLILKCIPIVPAVCLPVISSCFIAPLLVSITVVRYHSSYFLLTPVPCAKICFSFCCCILPNRPTEPSLTRIIMQFNYKSDDFAI